MTPDGRLVQIVGLGQDLEIEDLGQDLGQEDLFLGLDAQLQDLGQGDQYLDQDREAIPETVAEDQGQDLEDTNQVAVPNLQNVEVEEGLYI